MMTGRNVGKVKKRITTLTAMIEKHDAPDPLVLKLKERLTEKVILNAEVTKLQGEQYNLANQVSITSIVSDLVGRLESAGINVTISPLVKDKLAQDKPAIFKDRLMLREALRNSVESMTLDLPAKVITIIWKSKATSTVEMMFKRQGQKKAIYYYRSKTNGNPMSDWISIGALC